MIENLRFLRPDWFLAFIPLVLFLVVMFRRHHSSISWKAVCDDQLLAHVLIQTGEKMSRFPLWLVAFAASLSILAVAGPVWEKLPQPVFREQSALVILLDLSRSMDAADLKPSRLERAKLKTLDILGSRKLGQTALIVYAADAFVVTPLTDDTETIANLVPTLETQLMPAQGSSVDIGIQKATQLLKQAGITQGKILLITDGIPDDIKSITHNLRKTQHSVSILGVGTTDGSPIAISGGFLKDENGAIVISKLQPRLLRHAAQEWGGIYVNLQADDSDIERLNHSFSSSRIKTETEETELTADAWQEEGPWLLLMVLPFAALWSRKGWLLILPVLTSAVLLSLPEPAYAIDMKHLWSNPDQKAMQTLNSGNAEAAAKLFQHEGWKSSAYYRAGDYEKSISALKDPTSSNDFYNKGNALANLKRYPEAVEAYDKALKIDDKNEDAVYNRELVKKEIEQQNSQQNNNQQDNDSSNEQSESDKKDPSDNANSENSSQPSSNDEQSSSSDNSESDDNKQQNDNENEQAELENEAYEDRQESKEKPEEENPSMAMNESEKSEDEQATEQWLKRIPDDPGRLLRRKFLYQYKRMPHKPDKQPW